VRLALILAAALVLSGCAEEDTTGPGGGGKTDDLTNSAFHQALDGRGDVVSAWLKSAADAEGVVEGDYRTVLDAIGSQMGCAPTDEKTFAILLTRAEMHPRLMVTHCSSDPTKASEFFFTTQSDDGTLEDIDPRHMRMFAWDGTLRQYRTYELTAYGDAGLQVELDPPKCLQCHTTPANLDGSRMPFTPLMNELVNPWTLWNAQPDFDSHQFEQTIDPRFESAPIYGELTGGDKLDSAANFEKHIRAALDRVTNARMRARRNDANIQDAFDLLRPMFCDETLNYVSENHYSGETSAAVIIDDAIRRLYLQIRPDNWPWEWLNDGILRLPTPVDGEEPLAVMPVRGEATMQIEVALVARNVLTAEQALRVRALDWQRPALSDYRCNLFKRAEELVTVFPPDLSEYTRVSDYIPVLFEDIMQDHPVSDATRLVVVGDATDADFTAAVDAGDLSAYEMTVDEFGALLETTFDDAETDGSRANLEIERLRRGCQAVSLYPAAPLVPGVDPSCIAE